MIYALYEIATELGTIHIRYEIQEGSERGGNARLLTPLNNHFNADHFESVTIGKTTTIIPASHGAFVIIVNNLTQDSGRALTSQKTKVKGALSVALASEHASFAGTKWNQMSGADEIRGSRAGQGKSTGGESPIMR